jgi:tetratricopeptide (TPR) repeat protein
MQWSRTAWALAILFASLPLVSRLLLGTWEFEGSAGIAGLCLIAGTYFHLRSRRGAPAIPDYATLLDRANRKASEGRSGEAIVRLTKAIRLSPRLWQAFQYRGALYLSQNNAADALADFTEAIRLAPGEPHLYTLRGEAHRLLGDEASARKDDEAAARFNQVQG